MIKRKTAHDKIKRFTKKIIRKPLAFGQLKRLQRQLDQIEKMTLLGQMSAGVAHDIKNPLNLMVSFADLSLERTKELQNEMQTEKNVLTPEKIKTIETLLHFLEQNLQKIKDHGKRIDDLVKIMLMQSQGQQEQYQWVDLNHLLEENIGLVYHSMRVLERSIDIKIETNLDISIDKVKIVPQNFSRAFLNVLNNACFSVIEKRKKTTPEFSPLVSVTTRNLGKNIEIRIWDNGEGIPGKERNKLFTPFFTTKPAGVGTGLGLSIAYEIITHEYKGTIDFKSREGEYAEFIITLPKA